MTLKHAHTSQRTLTMHYSNSTDILTACFVYFVNKLNMNGKRKQLIHKHKSIQVYANTQSTLQKRTQSTEMSVTIKRFGGEMRCCLSNN